MSESWLLDDFEAGLKQFETALSGPIRSDLERAGCIQYIESDARGITVCDIGAHMVADSEIRPPDTMSETFDLMAETGILDGALAARLKKAVGFRNISVHNYRSIDWAIVHAICRHNLGDFDDSPGQSCPTWENSDRITCVRTIC